MRSAVIDSHGPPVDVVTLVEGPPPTPKSDEVLLRVLACPINPMDQLIIRGHYPLKATLPATPGSEGVAEVVDQGFDSGLMGKRVLLPIRSGSWRQQMCLKTTDLVVIPSHIDPINACTLRVNGATAAALVDTVEPGDWIIQNPGAGGVGQYVIQLAKARGVHTVNVVRSKTRIQRLTSLGADVCIVDSPNLHRQVKEATNGAAIAAAFDGVGGESTARLGRCLVRQGRVWHYGAMSRQAPQLRVADTIFKGIGLTGFWLYRFNQGVGQTSTHGLLEKLTKLRLVNEVAEVFPLTKIHAALTASIDPSVSGRVILSPNSD